MRDAEVIVVGAGGMGSAAAWQIARRGGKVLALEQFAVNHPHGSSHGHTRIIRQAYYEHPDYVPLVREAYRLWYDLEQSQGCHLLTSCPCLSIGKPGGDLVAGVQASAAAHGIPIEVLDREEVPRRFAGFGPLRSDEVGVVEPTAGFLYVDDCVRAMADAARGSGAEIHERETVLSWREENGGVRVVATGGTYFAKKLVLTAGPWSAALLGRMGVSLSVMRQVLLWLKPKDPALYRRDTFPIFIADTDAGAFYGLPMLDGRGVKVGMHYGAKELPVPDAVDRVVTEADEAPVRAFLARYIPGANGTLQDASTCIYTLTPDRHFLIDRHPDSARVIVAAGFSGHGFKFAPVIGSILADLALEGGTGWPVGLFGWQRLAAEPSRFGR